MTDVANREQLSIVIRYVDSETLTVREDLVGFFECDTGISGRDLADKIVNKLTEFGLIWHTSVGRLMMVREIWLALLMEQQH